MSILDYHLDAGMTGLDLRTALGSAHAAIPAIVLTADHHEATRSAVQAAGCHLMRKPLKPLALKALLGRVLLAPGD